MLSVFVRSVTQMLTTQADRFSAEEVRDTVQVTVMVSGCHGYIGLFSHPQMEQMFAAFPPDATGNLDYKNLVHIITHGEEKDQE